MVRKYLNYILFGVVVLAVLGAAIRHSQYVHSLVLGMSSSDVRVQSSSALELIKTEQFSDSITGESVSTRVHAAIALEALGNDASVLPDKSQKDAPDYRASAVQQAIALLKDTSSQVRSRAIETLQKIGDSSSGNLTKLIIGIGDGDNYVRKGVKAAFTASNGGIGPKPNVVDAIIARMKADDPTRGPGGDILSSTLFTQSGANARSLPLLIGFLTDRDAKGFKADEGLRSGAADALGKIGDATAIPTLIESMHHDTPRVRRVAIGALALIAAPAAEASLTEALSNLDDDKQARSQAAAGWGKIGSREAIDELLKALDDKDQDIRQAAIAALARAAHPRLSDPTTPAVLNAIATALTSGATDTIQYGAARTLQSALIGVSPSDAAASHACDVLLARLNSKSVDNRSRAIAAVALGYEGNRRAIPSLIESLSDPDGSVTIAAQGSLASIGPDATTALISVIKKGGTSSYYASLALGRLGIQALSDLQKTAADTSNPVGQRWAAVALGDLGVSEARPTLVQLSKSSNEDVAYVAKQQLNKLGQTE